MHPDISAFLRDHLKETLEKTRKDLLRAPYVPRTGGDPDFPEPDSNATSLRLVRAMIQNMQDTLVSRDIRPAMPTARKLASKFGLPDDEDALAELSLGLAQVSLQMFEKKAEWLQKGIIDRIEFERQPVPSEVLAFQQPPKPTDGPKLSELLPVYTDFMRTSGSWTGQTLAQNEKSFSMFLEVAGDLPVQAYDRKLTAGYYDVLRNLPANYSRPVEWRGMPLAEIAQQKSAADEPKLSMKTVKRHMTAISKLFKHLHTNGQREGENPAKGFEYPKPKQRSNEGRQEWKGQALAKLFQSPVWTGCASKSRRTVPGTKIIKDEKYWLPLLGLYHGNRLEEFAQLRIEDIQEEEGIWFFRINDEGNRQLKNAQSRRRVPIHPEVCRLGFLDYVKSFPPEPSGLVFPNLQPGGSDRKLGFYFSKWFGAYRKAVGVYEDKLDYHSFRASFITKLYVASVSEAMVHVLVGHEGKHVSSAVYLKEVPLPVLAEAMATVTYSEVAVAG